MATNTNPTAAPAICSIVIGLSIVVLYTMFDGKYKLFSFPERAKETAPLERTPNEKLTIFGMPKGAEDNRSFLDKISGVTPVIRSKELIKEKYPFTDTARKVIDEVPISNKKIEISGSDAEYTPNSGRFSYFLAKTLDPVVSKLSPELTNKIRGENVKIDNQENTTAGSHEFLHSLYQRKAIDKDEFASAWEAAKTKDPTGVLEKIDGHLSSDPVYKDNPLQQRNNERFAYLGSLKGRGGLKALPEELHPFYADVFDESSGKYEVGKGLVITDGDLPILRNVLYGEVSNRSKDKRQLEARAIINTAINRMAEYAARGQQKTLAEVLSEPNQYQAYGGKQYKIAEEGKADEEKIQAIDAVLEELKSGKLKDTTNGAVYYVHEDDGRITIKPGKLYKDL